MMIPADEVVCNPGPATLPEGAQIAVLLGSPAEEGPFVIRLKFPAGYEIPPHRHPQEEHVTVLSGGFGMGAGRRMIVRQRRCCLTEASSASREARLDQRRDRDPTERHRPVRRRIRERGRRSRTN